MTKSTASRRHCPWYGTTPYPCVGLLIAMIHLTGCSRVQPTQQKATVDVPVHIALNPEDDAKTMIEKVIASHGGKESLSRMNSGYFKYKPKGGPLSVLVGEVVMEDTFQLPGYFKRLVTKKRGNTNRTMLFVNNKENAWSKNDDKPTTSYENRAPAEWTEHPQIQLFDLLPFLDPELELTTRKARDNEPGNYQIIQVKSNQDDDVELWFDSNPARYRKSVRTIPGDDPQKPSISIVELSDYRLVKGIWFPFHIKSTFNGITVTEIEYLKVDFIERFDDRTFLKPE